MSGPYAAGTRVRIGNQFAERYNYERIVGKIVVMQTGHIVMSSGHPYYEVFSTDYVTWYVRVDDVHPLNPPTNEEAIHLLNKDIL